MEVKVSKRATLLAALFAVVVAVFACIGFAYALEGVSAQATSEAGEYPANTWVPLEVSISNESSQDIVVVEAGFKSLPEGLELKSGDALATTHTDTQVAAGSSSYVSVHKMEVRKVTEEPAPDPDPTTDPTPDPDPTTDPTPDTTPEPTPTPKPASDNAKKTAAKGATPTTGDNSIPGLVALALVFAGACSVYTAYRVKHKGLFSLLLIACLIAAGAFALPARNAKAATATETAECTITVKIDGTDYLFDGYVVYSYEQAEPTPDPEPEPETVDVEVTKVWVDADDQDGIRPDSVAVTLLADGEAVDEASLDASSDWKHVFGQLPKYEGENEIAYTVQETAVEGYSSEVTGDAQNGFTITNTHTPATITITLEKTWEDGNGDPWRPHKIDLRRGFLDKIHVYNNVTDLAYDGNDTEFLRYGETKTWVAIWINVPKYAGDADAPIDWQFREDTIDHYTSGTVTKTTDADGNITFTLTNTLDD